MLLFNTPKTENLIELNTEVKLFLLDLYGVSPITIRREHPYNDKYLSFSQIREVNKEIERIMNEMDRLAMEDPDRTKTSIVETINEKYNDEDWVTAVVNKRLELATSDGTYSAYQDLVKEYLSQNNI